MQNSLKLSTLVGAPIKTTLRNIQRAWANVPHKFQVNLNEAVAGVGRYAVATFKGSFSKKAFNSANGAPWPSLKGKANPGHSSLLIETGALKDSITYSVMQNGLDREIDVYTDPKVFARENRNPSGKCFAAIHNSGGGIAATPGSKAAGILQRQFMPTDRGMSSSGDSSYMEDKLRNLHVKIFRNLPQ